MKTRLTLIFLALSFLCHAQNSEVDKLKNELAEATTRATKAEEAARRAMGEAKKFQMEAEVARAVAERAEAGAIRARHICQAKLLSIKSLELGADPQQEALVVLLAYKFNSQYRGDPMDRDLHKGLKAALALFNDPLSKSQDAQMTAMAKSLCSYVNRDLTKDEWVNFAGSDLKQEKVCGE